MKKKLLIVGAGGCGREVAHMAKDRQKTNTVDWELYGFLDDNLNALDGIDFDVPIVGSVHEWEPKEDEVFVCALGSPTVKENIAALLEEKGAKFANVIHPTAIIADNAEYGHGLIACQYSSISVNTRVGKHVMINLHTNIGHDACVGDFSVISAFCDITGRVKLGRKVFLGSHVAIAPGLKVGDDASVGIGSVVVASVRAGKSVFGNPAKTFML